MSTPAISRTLGRTDTARLGQLHVSFRDGVAYIDSPLGSVMLQPRPDGRALATVVSRGPLVRFDADADADDQGPPVDGLDGLDGRGAPA